MAKEVDVTLNQYLAADLIRHSTSPYSSPLEVIPKKSGGVRIIVNYTKLNKISSLSQLPIPHVDQVLNSLSEGTGVFPVRLVFFVPPNHRAQGHRLSHGVLHSDGPLWVARHAPGQQGFTRVVRQGYQRSHKWLGTSGAHLHDVIVFEPGPTAHVEGYTYALRAPARL